MDGGIRTLIVDDSEMFRTGLRMIIESGASTTVIGEAASGAEAVAIATANPGGIDVILMDIDMPDMNGIDATREIARMSSPPHVLMLTTYALDSYVYDAIVAGASGFLLKDVPPDSLLAAIESTHAGTSVVSRQMTRQIFRDYARHGESAQSEVTQQKIASLTDREREILILIGRGLNNTEISENLMIAEVTVKTHVGHIFRKLSTRDRIQCVVFAYQAGLMTADG